MFYTLIKHIQVFDQSERAQGSIFIIKADKAQGMLAARDERILDCRGEAKLEIK